MKIKSIKGKKVSNLQVKNIIITYRDIVDILNIISYEQLGIIVDDFKEKMDFLIDELKFEKISYEILPEGFILFMLTKKNITFLKKVIYNKSNFLILDLNKYFSLKKITENLNFILKTSEISNNDSDYQIDVCFDDKSLNVTYNSKMEIQEKIQKQLRERIVLNVEEKLYKISIKVEKRNNSTIIPTILLRKMFLILKNENEIYHFDLVKKEKEDSVKIGNRQYISFKEASNFLDFKRYVCVDCFEYFIDDLKDSINKNIFFRKIEYIQNIIDISKAVIILDGKKQVKILTKNRYLKDQLLAMCNEYNEDGLLNETM